MHYAGFVRWPDNVQKRFAGNCRSKRNSWGKIRPNRVRHRVARSFWNRGDRSLWQVTEFATEIELFPPVGSLHLTVSLCEDPNLVKFACLRRHRNRNQRGFMRSIARVLANNFSRPFFGLILMITTCEKLLNPMERTKKMSWVDRIVGYDAFLLRTAGQARGTFGYRAKKSAWTEFY